MLKVCVSGELRHKRNTSNFLPTQRRQKYMPEKMWAQVATEMKEMAIVSLAQ